MPVLTRLIPSPVVVDISRGAMDDLVGLLADQRISASGKLAIAISGGSGTALRARLEPVLPHADWYAVGDGTIDSAVKLADDMKGRRYDAVVGLGGGKIIDVAKYAAARVGLPMVSVATNLSHDGICSPVSILDNDNGRGSYGVPTPIAMVIDLDVIKEAPVRFIRAGIGDALSNISSIADWELSHKITGEPVDGLAAAMARTMRRGRPAPPRGLHRRRVPHRSLRGPGPDRHRHVDQRRQPPGVRRLPRDQPRLRPALPGPLRAPRRAGRYGRRLRDAPAGAEEQSGLFVEVLRRHGLPTAPEEIGFSADEFVAAVEYAPQTRPGRFTILEHLNLSAAEIRDAYADYAKTIRS